MKLVHLLLLIVSLSALSAKECSSHNSKQSGSNSRTNRREAEEKPGEAAKAQPADENSLTATPTRLWKCSDLATTGAVFGVTITDIDHKFLTETQNRIRELSAVSKVPVVTRIVIDPIIEKDEAAFQERLNDYKRYVSEIQKVSCVMGELGDSYDLHNYFPTTKANGRIVPPRAHRTYVEWTSRVVSALGRDVDVWEIGNELNGDWTAWKCDNNGENCEHEGKSLEQKIERQREVLRATEAAYNEIMRLKARNEVKADALTAVTLYYNEDADDGQCTDHTEARLKTWLQLAEKTLGETVKQKLDFVLLSFYESDCGAVARSPLGVAKTFASIRNVFTGESTGFGFGEIGYKGGKCKGDGRVNNKACQAANPQYIKKYYSELDCGIREALSDKKFQQPRPLRYVGGYFYWWYLQDAVISTKNDFQATRNAFTNSAANFADAACRDPR